MFGSLTHPFFLRGLLEPHVSAAYCPHFRVDLFLVCHGTRMSLPRRPRRSHFAQVFFWPRCMFSFHDVTRTDREERTPEALGLYGLLEIGCEYDPRENWKAPLPHQTVFLTGEWLGQQVPILTRPVARVGWKLFAAK